jgi:hypothetical protein
MVTVHTRVKGLGVVPPPARRPCRRGGSQGGPGSKRPAPALEPKIDLDRLDLDRLVWDPEYRDEIRHRLNRHA